MCAGCGPENATLYPVRGKVTMGGKPLADCSIQFAVPGTRHTFNSQIGADGTYSLIAADGRPGAPQGKYKVVLQMSPQAQVRLTMSGTQPDSVRPRRVTLFPEDYSTAETSPQEVEVQARENTINVEIPAAP
jgi:hypothetical protein